jgi:hypothetical protein
VKAPGRGADVGPGGGGPGPITETVARVALDLLVQAGPPAVLPVHGYSMWPTLRPGEQVEVRPPDGPLSAGDIVVVRVGGRTVAHRVVEIRKQGAGFELRLKGDTNLTFDRGRVGRAQVAGVVQAVRRSGSSVNRLFLQGRPARWLAAISRGVGTLCAPLAFLAAVRRRS